MAPPSATDPIVVGYDDSPPSQAALWWAARAARRSGTGVLIMHAADRIDDIQDPNDGRWQVENAAAEAEKVAERGSNIVRQAFSDLPVHIGGSLFGAEVALGESPPSTTMVVLGNKGGSLIDTLHLGSTVYAIAGYARCPVVIVRDGTIELPGPGRPVVVGVTEAFDQAVDAGANLAQEWEAPLLLATTWSPDPTESWDEATTVPDREVSAAYENKAKQTNQEATDRVRATHKHLDVTGTVLQADPVEGLIQSANRGGLLILGARVHSLGGAVLGSTSLGVLHRGRMPIMIVD